MCTQTLRLVCTHLGCSEDAVGLAFDAFPTADGRTDLELFIAWLFDEEGPMDDHPLCKHISGEFFALIDIDGSKFIEEIEFQTVKSILTCHMPTASLRAEGRIAVGKISENAWHDCMNCVLVDVGENEFLRLCRLSFNDARSLLHQMNIRGHRMNPWFDIDFTALNTSHVKIEEVQRRAITLKQMESLLNRGGGGRCRQLYPQPDHTLDMEQKPNQKMQHST